jgi:hypothetical protein
MLILAQDPLGMTNFPGSIAFSQYPPQQSVAIILDVMAQMAFCRQTSDIWYRVIAIDK